MQPPQVVSREQWLKARLKLLDKEKAHSRMRDELTRERQALPWVKIEKEYTFDAPTGKVTLKDLFGGKSQLIVQHFMFDEDWEAGCKFCSFMADHMDRSVVHIAHRDTAFVAVSIAPLPKLEAFKRRMQWTFPWVSSRGSSFNRDFHVSFTDEEIAKSKCYYNFREGVTFPAREAQGISVFARDDAGTVYHTYSMYARGTENVMTAYNLLDLVPRGRDEADLPYGLKWVHLKDEYDDAPSRSA